MSGSAPPTPTPPHVRALPPAGSPGRAAAPTPRLDSRQLFGEATELLIEHNGALYRLRRTAAGKLILTK